MIWTIAAYISALSLIDQLPGPLSGHIKVTYISGVLRGVGLVALRSLGGDGEAHTHHACLLNFGVDSGREWPVLSVRAF